MKSFNQYTDPIDEGIIRTGSSTVLTMKVRDITKRIESIKINTSDTDVIRSYKIQRKLDLISKQSLYQTYLIVQLGIMKKWKNILTQKHQRQSGLTIHHLNYLKSTLNQSTTIWTSQTWSGHLWIRSFVRKWWLKTVSGKTPKSDVWGHIKTSLNTV